MNAAPSPADLQSLAKDHLWGHFSKLTHEDQGSVTIIDHGAGCYRVEFKGDPVFDNMKTVVLVNGGTASASEILSSALRDHGKATLIGEKTFGKGSVQQIIKLSGGAELKVTVAHWYTPKGINVMGKGITPDKTVKLTQKDNDAARDPQLQAALQALGAK